MSWSNYLGHIFILDPILYGRWFNPNAFEELKNQDEVKYIYLKCEVCNCSCRYQVRDGSYQPSLFTDKKILPCHEQVIKNILE